MSCDKIIPNAKAIFIVESPHIDEVKNTPCIPLVGESGKIMSKMLFGKDKAIGLLEDNPYSLMNTFTEALQKSDKLKDLNSDIKKIEYENSKQYKDELKQIYKKYESVINKENYKTRFISISKKTNKCIICGLIAQAFFEYAFDVDKTKFKQSFDYKVNKYKKIKIFYIEHPSPKDDESPWVANGIKELKTFLEIK